jgi:hypothetical protein
MPGRLGQFCSASQMAQGALAAVCQRMGLDLGRGTSAKIESGIRPINDAEVVLLAHVLKIDLGRLLEGMLREN